MLASSGSTPRPPRPFPACSPFSPMRTCPTCCTGEWSRTGGSLPRRRFAGKATSLPRWLPARHKSRLRPQISSRSTTKSWNRFPTFSPTWVNRPSWSTKAGADYEADESLGRSRNTLGHSSIVKGDATAAMATAEVVVHSRYVSDASQGAPIEPRAILAQWQGDKVTVWSSTQVPFAARSGIAYTLQIPESQVRVIVPLLGGGFGSKCDFPFRSTRRRSGPRHSPAGEAGVLAPGGVLCS